MLEQSRRGGFAHHQQQGRGFLRPAENAVPLDHWSRTWAPPSSGGLLEVARRATISKSDTPKRWLTSSTTTISPRATTRPLTTMSTGSPTRLIERDHGASRRASSGSRPAVTSTRARPALSLEWTGSCSGSGRRLAPERPVLRAALFGSGSDLGFVHESEVARWWLGSYGVRTRARKHQTSCAMGLAISSR